LSASPHELNQARFAANPDDRAAFEFLEERHFMDANWAGLAELYRRRQSAPSLAPRARAAIALRLGQIYEERLGDVEGAIRSYTEAVQLEPSLRRALQPLRRLYASRGSWEAVLQIAEQEATVAESAKERARLLVEMGDVWMHHLDDRTQAELLYARASVEGGPGFEAVPAPEAAPQAAPPAASPPQRAAETKRVEEAPGADEGDLSFAFDPAPADEPQGTLTMPDLEDSPAPVADQRADRVLGVLERKLAAREARGQGLDVESVRLRVRIAELRGGVMGDPVAAIAVLEPALARGEALLEVAPMLAGLYDQLGSIEPLIALAQGAAAASGPREQRTFWFRRAAEVARAAGEPERAVECYERLLGDAPRDRGARAALADLHRTRGNAEPLVRLLREELVSASPERELELQLELASLVWEGLRDPMGALPHLRRCLELEPTRTDLLEQALAACALRGGELAQLDLVEHVIERAGSDAARAALLARRGTLLADALQWNEEADASWRAALALDPAQPIARARLAAL
jgi:tetratricopeptide (TPR) repeat protein